jgi:hypothetical protein
MRSTTRRTALALSAAALAGAGVTGLTTGSAEAIPVAQKTCSFTYSSIAAEHGWRAMGMGVTIRNGDTPRKVVAQLAADIGVDTQAEVRVGYQIDGGPIQERVFGPANLANHTEYWQTRSTLAVIPVGKGTHTITPYWRISGATGKKGYFQTGCFTVEGRTR